MDAKNYWQLFLETGAPEMYLMYIQQRKQDLSNAPESSGSGRSGNQIQ